MARKSLIQMRIEEKEAEGYKLYKQGSGKIVMLSKSKLRDTYADCAATKPQEVIFVTGAKKRYASEGHDWAVMYKTA